jgi:N utilization substance protein B
MALQLLFQTEFLTDARNGGKNGEKADLAAKVRAPSPSEMLKRFVADFDIESEVAEYAGAVFLGVTAKISEIDAIIQAHSSHWKVSRMGLVDLAVMRVAVYEMKFTTPPLSPRIAIDEAVEVAKKYGSTESGAFVNGILDHVARGL